VRDEDYIGFWRKEEFYTKGYYLVSGLIRAIEERLKKRLDVLERYSENFWFTYLLENRQAAPT
jgi:hypothetical protein